MQHLKENGETYWEHLRFTWSVAFVMMVHGLMPSVWEYRASEMIALQEHKRNEYIRRSRI